MHAMTEFEVYKMYLALKLHFTTEKYDVIEQQGKIRASKQAFAKRKDLFSIKKVSKTYSDEEVANFLVANFTSGDRWGGIFDSEAGERYIEWRKKIESLPYIFEKDLDGLLLEFEKDNLNFDVAFKIERNNHPYIIRCFLRKIISLETLVIIDKLEPFISKFDKEIDDDIMWPDISRMIRKYKPFLKFDKAKYNAIFRTRFRHNDSENNKS